MRRDWEKFGAAARSAESMTAASNEEIPFENMRTKTKTMQQNRIEDIQKSLEDGDKRTVVKKCDDPSVSCLSVRKAMALCAEWRTCCSRRKKSVDCKTSGAPELTNLRRKQKSQPERRIPTSMPAPSRASSTGCVRGQVCSTTFEAGCCGR